MTRTLIALVLIIALLVVGVASVFVVDEREKVLVLRFGRIVNQIEQPGLAFKMPFVDTPVAYDDRIQSLDTDELEVTPLDARRLIIDAFARWRISDLLQFRQANAGAGIEGAEQRLERILNAALREVLGSVTSDAILSAERVDLMNRIRDVAISESSSLGIEVVDVRIKRADLPNANLEFTFDRMRTEREREARDERARGEEAAARIVATANRTALEEVSGATRDSSIIRGEADAERNRIFAQAYGRDPEFFAFYRSLNAYRTALQNNNSTLVLSPDSEFFDYLSSDAPILSDEPALQPAVDPAELEAERQAALREAERAAQQALEGSLGDPEEPTGEDPTEDPAPEPATEDPAVEDAPDADPAPGDLAPTEPTPDRTDPAPLDTPDEEPAPNAD